MHKSWGNMVEFNEGADKIGVDVMRWMFATHNPEQNMLFGYKTADETRRKFHLMLWNVYNFFLTYANTDEYQVSSIKHQVSSNVLDRWILSRLNKTIESSTKSLEKYNAQKASEEIENFVNDLSLWYVRRSRDRIGPSAENEKDKRDCYETLYTVLVSLAKLLAPFTPFLAEEIFTNLTGEKSVHLSDWPEADKALINKELEKEMEEARVLVEVSHALRKNANIKVRIPLKKMDYNGPKELSKEVLKVVMEEINVYELSFAKKTDEFSVSAETSEKNQDMDFGLARDIVRQIQEQRKNLKTKPSEKVNVEVPYWPEEFTDYIKKKALVSTLSKGEFSVKRNE